MFGTFFKILKHFRFIFIKAKIGKIHMNKKSCGIAFYITVQNFGTLRSKVKNFKFFAEGLLKF